MNRKLCVTDFPSPSPLLQDCPVNRPCGCPAVHCIVGVAAGLVVDVDVDVGVGVKKSAGDRTGTVALHICAGGPIHPCLIRRLDVPMRDVEGGSCYQPAYKLTFFFVSSPQRGMVHVNVNVGVRGQALR